MTTREEIEAAAARYEAGAVAYVKQKDDIGAWSEYWRPAQKDNDLHTLANAYLAERAERQRRIETAAEELDSVLTELSCVASPKARQVAIARVITKHLEQS